MESGDYLFKPLTFSAFTEVGYLFNGFLPARPGSSTNLRIVCNDSNFYAFGEGSYQLGELWCFNFAEGSWKLLPTTGQAPNLLSPCTALYGNFLYVLGGPYQGGGSPSNKLIICDLRSLKWEEVATTGDVPELQNYGQALLLDEEKRQLYVVGGVTGPGFTMDIYRLDLPTKSWKLINYRSYHGEPSNRYLISHLEIGYDGRNVYVFGGGMNAYELDTIPVFNIDTNQWSKLETKSSNVPSETQVAIVNNNEKSPREDGFPKCRKDQASVQIVDDVYICGGHNDGTVYNDVWKFHIPTSTWQLLKEKIPIPLAFHTACVTSEGCMYVFGGLTDTERWVQNNMTFKMWLKIPKLKEICWEAVLNYNKNFRMTSCEALVEMGIPSEFAKRAHPSPPGGKPNKDAESVWESDYFKYLITEDSCNEE